MGWKSLTTDQVSPFFLKSFFLSLSLSLLCVCVCIRWLCCCDCTQDAFSETDRLATGSHSTSGEGGSQSKVEREGLFV